MSDAEALAGQTFYRAVASPSRPGWESYIQLFNPPGSGVNLFLDELYLFSGVTTSSEYGLLHYATPFDSPALALIVLDVACVPFLPTRYGLAAPAGVAKSKIYLGTYPAPLADRVDYFWQCSPVSQQPNDNVLPYPLIFGPGDGCVLWNCTPSLEGKAGMWIREKPIA